MSKIQKNTSNNQLFVYLPKILSRALGFKKGDEVDWKISKRGNLELVKE